MVAAVANAKPAPDLQPRAHAKTDLVDIREPASTRENLHAKPERLAENFEFAKVKADTASSPRLKSLLNRFEINDKATQYDNAVLSKDGKTLFIVNRGPVALRELFGGSNAFTRVLYKSYSWLVCRLFDSANRAIAAGKYREMFNAADIDMQHEPLKHLFQSFKSGEYHSVSVFYRNTETGEFDKDPNAVAVIDTYKNVIAPNLRREMEERKAPEAEIKAEIKKREAEFEDCYAADKFIPIKEGLKMGQLFHQVAEALYQAQGYKMLTLPAQVHTNTNMNSNDLNYQEVDYHHVAQDADAKWFLNGDPKLLDQLDSIAQADKDRYLQKLKPSPYSPKLTIARSINDAEKPIDPYLAYAHQWSLMSKGTGLRTTKKKDLELVELAEPINAAIIEAYNRKLAKTGS